MLGIVELGALEPSRPRHRPRTQHTLIRSRSPNREVVPDRAPEAFEVRCRPGPQLVVAGERSAPFAFQPGQVAPDLGALPRVGRRRPQHLQSETSTTTAAPVSPAAHPVNSPMPPPRSSSAYIS